MMDLRAWRVGEPCVAVGLLQRRDPYRYSRSRLFVWLLPPSVSIQIVQLKAVLAESGLCGIVGAFAREVAMVWSLTLTFHLELTLR